MILGQRLLETLAQSYRDIGVHQEHPIQGYSRPHDDQNLDHPNAPRPDITTERG
jgi:hypothetical protein